MTKSQFEHVLDTYLIFCKKGEVDDEDCYLSLFTDEESYVTVRGFPAEFGWSYNLRLGMIESESEFDVGSQTYCCTRFIPAECIMYAKFGLGWEAIHE